MFQPTHAALSGRFIYAPQFASHIHAAQRSKGRDISYWSPKKEYRDENCNMESGNPFRPLTKHRLEVFQFYHESR